MARGGVASSSGQGRLAIHRFFFSPEAINGKKVLLEERVCYQLREVLRLRPGSSILLLDNAGWEYQAMVTKLGKEAGEAEIMGREPATGEPRTRIHLYQAVLKGDKFELVLQKGTEIGVSAFTPLFTLRCVVSEISPHKQERWRRIIVEAAEQSARGLLPALGEPLLFTSACEQVRGLTLMPYEGERKQGLREATRGIGDNAVNLFICPEGGFEPEEVEFARRCGIVPVSLGKRILRAETAGLVTAAAILYDRGELDPEINQEVKQ